MVDKSESVVIASATSSAANLVGNVLDKEIPDIPKLYGCTKLSTDFAATLQEIDDKIQRFSNSNSSTAMIIKGSDKTDAEIKGEERSLKILDQAIKDSVNDEDMVLDGKVMALNSAELKELNFEMGWVGKNHTKKGGPSKICGKEKNKLNRPSLIHATPGLDQDILMQNGPKRKGEALDVDSMECGEKEKRVKRELVVSNTSLYLGSAEAVGQPCRV